jgi:hypothetical protein
MIPSTKQFNINLIIYFIVVLNICDKLVSNVVSSIAFDSSESSQNEVKERDCGVLTRINKSFKEFWEYLRNFGAYAKEF